MATADELIEEIENYSPLKDLLPADVQFPYSNILLFGETGCGKSTVYNTINSVFRGKIFNTAISGSYQDLVTKKFHRYRVMPRTKTMPQASNFFVSDKPAAENDQLMGEQKMLNLPDGSRADKRSSKLPQPMKFRICDSRGLEPDHLMSEKNMSYILEGNIADRFPLNPSGNISSDMPGFNKHPGLHDRIHCVAIVQDATIVDAMQALSPEVNKNIKEMQTVMNSLDIPQVVLLTKTDCICEATMKDPAFALESWEVDRRVSKTAEIFGLPRNSIFPVKNYEAESCLEPSVDLLALRALREILNNCDAHLYHHIHEIINNYKIMST